MISDDGKFSPLNADGDLEWLHQEVGDVLAGGKGVADLG